MPGFDGDDAVVGKSALLYGADDQELLNSSPGSLSTIQFKCNSKIETPGGPHSDAGIPNKTFGDYELLEVIARGGMGVVYKARQTKLNRIVALKMIRSGTLADEEQNRTLSFEAEAGGKLDHPGIVPIHDIGQHAGQHYRFSMGFHRGECLARRGCHWSP